MISTRPRPLRAHFLQTYAVLPEDVDGLAAVYRLGGLEALADAHGALFEARGWEFLKSEAAQGPDHGQAGVGGS